MSIDKGYDETLHDTNIIHTLVFFNDISWMRMHRAAPSNH